ncbi:Ribonuclease 3 [compost metagenome]
MKEEDKLLKLQNKLQYIFTDLNLLKIALTHKSYAYEKKEIDPTMYNERLEYLGDAILEHIVSEILFNHTPALSEGDMTKKRANIVCEKTLASAFRDIGGEQYIYLGKCEKTTNGQMKDAILCDMFESVIGAVYIDGGYDMARVVAIDLLQSYITNTLQGKELVEDYKTILQEKLQINGNVKIEYILINQYGPDHDKTFSIDLLLNDKKIGEGIGKSKKSAEQEAAKNALKKIV